MAWPGDGHLVRDACADLRAGMVRLVAGDASRAPLRRAWSLPRSPTAGGDRRLGWELVSLDRSRRLSDASRGASLQPACVFPAPAVADCVRAVLRRVRSGGGPAGRQSREPLCVLGSRRIDGVVFRCGDRWSHGGLPRDLTDGVRVRHDLHRSAAGGVRIRRSCAHAPRTAMARRAARAGLWLEPPPPEH